MEQRQWFNQSLPQTLQIAVLLLYLNGFFIALDVLLGGIDSTFFFVMFALVAVGHFVAGTGIASEQRSGYRLGIAMAVFPFALRLWFGGLDFLLGASLISLMFEIALVALLVHPQSQEHQRVWFH